MAVWPCVTAPLLFCSVFVAFGQYIESMTGTTSLLKAQREKESIQTQQCTLPLQVRSIQLRRTR